MKSAFDKIAAGLDDAITYAGGDPTRGREATVDVKIREANRMIAGSVRRSVLPGLAAVRDWEQAAAGSDTGSAICSDGRSRS